MFSYEIIKRICEQIISELKRRNLIDAGYLEKDSEENVNNIVNLYIITTSLKIKEIMECKEEMLEQIFTVGALVHIKKFLDGFYFKLENSFSMRVYLKNDYQVNLINFEILYDVNKKIIYKENKKSPETIGSLINDFVYSLDLFYMSYNSEDCISSLNKLMQASDTLLLFLNYNYNESYFCFNKMSYLKVLPKNIKLKYLEIINKLKIDSLLECAKLMIVLIDDFVINVPINVAFAIDIDYYLYIKRMVFNQ